jgi:hypothetical protein
MVNFLAITKVYHIGGGMLMDDRVWRYSIVLLVLKYHRTDNLVIPESLHEWLLSTREPT